MLKKMDELHENGRWEEGIISSLLEKAKDRRRTGCRTAKNNGFFS